jgi:hypothetical protein
LLTKTQNGRLPVCLPDTPRARSPGSAYVSPHRRRSTCDHKQSSQNRHLGDEQRQTACELTARSHLPTLCGPGALPTCTNEYAPPANGSACQRVTSCAFTAGSGLSFPQSSAIITSYRSKRFLVWILAGAFVLTVVRQQPRYFQERADNLLI